MNQAEVLFKFFKTGKLQKIIMKEILKTLPKEEQERFRKEGMPDEIKSAVNEEIRKQLLQAGIPEEKIQGVIE